MSAWDQKNQGRQGEGEKAGKSGEDRGCSSLDVLDGFVTCTTATMVVTLKVELDYHPDSIKPPSSESVRDNLGRRISRLTRSNHFQRRCGVILCIKMYANDVKSNKWERLTFRRIALLTLRAHCAKTNDSIYFFAAMKFLSMIHGAPSSVERYDTPFVPFGRYNSAIWLPFRKYNLCAIWSNTEIEPQWSRTFDCHRDKIYRWSLNVHQFFRFVPKCDTCRIPDRENLMK